MIDNSELTGKDRIDADPAEVPDADRDHLFGAHQGTRNFVTYIGPDYFRKEMKIRVNCKCQPCETKVPHPKNTRYSKKTTLIKWQGQTIGELSEDRALELQHGGTARFRGATRWLFSRRGRE